MCLHLMIQNSYIFICLPYSSISMCLKSHKSTSQCSLLHSPVFQSDINVCYAHLHAQLEVIVLCVCLYLIHQWIAISLLKLPLPAVD